MCDGDNDFLFLYVFSYTTKLMMVPKSFKKYEVEDYSILYPKQKEGGCFM